MFKEFEKKIVRILLGTGIDSDLLDEILDGGNILIETTETGYFVEVLDERLPEKRSIFSKPLTTIRHGGLEAGFVVILGDRSLVLESYTIGPGKLRPEVRHSIPEI